MEEKEVPNPGSREARDLGCVCPVLDNNYGRGIYTDKDGEVLFYMVANCPLHGTGDKE